MGDSGSGVIILQNLVARSPFVHNLNISGVYDSGTVAAVTAFQAGNKLPASGVFSPSTASLLLKLHSDDGYVDDGSIPSGYLYKVYIPVYANRSVEVWATLYDRNMSMLYRALVRARGQSNSKGQQLNQFCPNGVTPTGLMTFDLNTPEPDPLSYGPYPINRAVQGLRGNAAFLISNIRDGILMHTGEWPDWNYTMPMPNSHGCVHGHPEEIYEIWQLLVGLGVEARPNTYGKLPYPYKPQGILSIEQID